MSDKPSHQERTASRKFSPEVKLLERRLLLSQSQKLSFPGGGSFVFPPSSIYRGPGAYSRKRARSWASASASPPPTRCR